MEESCVCSSVLLYELCVVCCCSGPSEKEEKEAEEEFVSHTFKSEQAMLQAYAESEAAAEGLQMEPHSDCGKFQVTLTFARLVARLKSEGGLGGPPSKPETDTEGEVAAGGGGGGGVEPLDEVAKRVEDALTLNYKLKKTAHPNLPYLIADCSPILIVETAPTPQEPPQAEVGQVRSGRMVSVPERHLCAIPRRSQRLRPP